MPLIKDLETCKQTDFDRSDNLRGLIRTGRRWMKRCWLDKANICRPRVFCQNSGGCGSTYIVKLLQANGVERVFHEKTPDLLQLGLDHFEKRQARNRVVGLLRYSRHDVHFEANNRLFSLSQELYEAFPAASFIHLHRDPVEAIRSAMSKPDIEGYLANDVRFQGSLAGPKSATLFERFCHHWANMNRRIHEDLQAVQQRGGEVLSLKFEDLISGEIDDLEIFLGKNLNQQIEPANIGRLGKRGKFPRYLHWTREQKNAFETICLPVAQLLKR